MEKTQTLNDAIQADINTLSIDNLLSAIDSDQLVVNDMDNNVVIIAINNHEQLLKVYADASMIHLHKLWWEKTYKDNDKLKQYIYFNYSHNISIAIIFDVTQNYLSNSKCDVKELDKYIGYIKGDANINIQKKNTYVGQYELICSDPILFRKAMINILPILNYSSAEVLVLSALSNNKNSLENAKYIIDNVNLSNNEIAELKRVMP